MVLLPLRSARVTNATLSASQSCIGSYNGATLDPAKGCQPDSTHPQYTDGASLDGYFTLEDSDAIVVSALSQSLCVILSGNATMYGTMNSMGVTVCKRDSSNKILYQGDWCDGGTTPPANKAATPSCAVRLRLVRQQLRSELRF